jgi:uncharacterized protein
MSNAALRVTAVYVVLAYAISWTIWQAGFSTVQNLTSLQDERFGAFLLAGSFGPTIAALLVVGFSGGRSAIIAMLRRLIQFRVRWQVYLFVFFAVPIIGMLLQMLLGTPSNIPLWQIALTLIPLGPVNALFGGIIFGQGPLGEEMGWRGVLQENLQKPFNSVVVATVVGIIWAFWHYPLFRFADFRNGLDLAVYLPLYVLSLIVIAFTIGHIWRWSKGSLLLVIFFHAVINTVAAKLTDADWWNFERLGNLNGVLMIILMLTLTAIAAEVLSRTAFRGFFEEA